VANRQGETGGRAPAAWDRATAQVVLAIARWAGRPSPTWLYLLDPVLVLGQVIHTCASVISGWRWFSIFSFYAGRIGVQHLKALAVRRPRHRVARSARARLAAQLRET